jgi:hypothetical protein
MHGRNIMMGLANVKALFLYAFLYIFLIFNKFCQPMAHNAEAPPLARRLPHAAPRHRRPYRAMLACGEAEIYLICRA